MSFICSIGNSIPENNLSQKEIKQFINEIFPRSEKEKKRLLPVFDHAQIENRQFVVPKSWFEKEHSFHERNAVYFNQAVNHSTIAIDKCLHNESLLHSPVPYDAIDAIIFVSSTGISTPSIDAYILNERNFRADMKRIPMWGLGCAGGISGLARAHEWLSYYPFGNVLVVCVELCSLTFQKSDKKKSNFVGTALFGDGVSAALVIGEKSNYVSHRKKYSPKITAAHSLLKKNALEIMGWDITDTGFEVIFSKSIPRLVETFWKEHLYTFLDKHQCSLDDFSFYIAHPGGAKVLEAMKGVLNTSDSALKYSYQVLKNHGNMSSATILYVLAEWLKEDIEPGSKSLASALGPGFSSEFLSLEWG